MIEKFDFCRSWRLEEALKKPTQKEQIEELWTLFDSYQKSVMEEAVVYANETLNKDYIKSCLSDIQSLVDDIEGSL